MAKPERYTFVSSRAVWDKTGAIGIVIALCLAIAMVVAVSIWVL